MRHSTQSPQELKPLNRENPEHKDSRALNREFVSDLAQRLDLSAYPLAMVPAGRWLLRTAERLTRLPLVVCGTLEAVYQLGDQGNQVIPVTFSSGELAMISALFSTAALQVDLMAAEDVSLRWVPIADLEKCLLSSQDLLVLMVRFLAQRLREVQLRERGWLERGVHLRVCAALVRVARDTPPRPDGRWFINATHEHLASRCGVSRPKLSHELKRMEHAGRLKLHRGAIEILDRSGFSSLG